MNWRLETHRTERGWLPILDYRSLSFHSLWLELLRRRSAGASCSTNSAKSFQEVVQIIRQRMKKDVFTTNLLSTSCFQFRFLQLAPFYTSTCIAACRTKPMNVTKSSRGTRKH